GEALGDGHDLLRCLALAEDHLREPVAQAAVMIQAREAKVLVRQGPQPVYCLVDRAGAATHAVQQIGEAFAIHVPRVSGRAAEPQARSAEVVEARATERDRAPVLVEQADHGPPGNDAADASQPAAEPAGQTLEAIPGARRCGAEQLVVLARGRREASRAGAERAPARGRDWHAQSVDLGRHAARSADVPEILDQPVADVDHGANHLGQQPPRAEPDRHRRPDGTAAPRGRAHGPPPPSARVPRTWARGRAPPGVTRGRPLPPTRGTVIARWRAAARSPPTTSTPARRASPARPCISWSRTAAGNRGGATTATSAARGRPPIAATSLSFTRSARRPRDAGDSQPSSKCTPSTSVSVVRSRGRRVARMAAASSPGRSSVPRPRGRRRTARAIQACSPRSSRACGRRFTATRAAI